MGAGLYRELPGFREEMDACFRLLQREMGVDLRPILFAPERLEPDRQKRLLRGEAATDPQTLKLNQTLHAQPILFVIEYCLARVLMGWGVVPQAVVGYSLGEFVAATLAGVLSLPDALRVAAGRARLIEPLAGGSMLAVPLSAEEVEPLLGAELSIGISNGPKLTVVSGPQSAMTRLEAVLADKAIVSRRLPTSHAFHSAMMEPAAAGLRQLLKSVELRSPRIRCLSNVTGRWLTADEATDPEYWVRHLCRRARFAECLDSLLAEEDWAMVEVGPGQSLSSLVIQRAVVNRSESAPVVVPTLRTAYVQADDQGILTGALAKLWVAGTAPDWKAYYAGERRRRIPLPTYAFERQRYWIDAVVEDASIAQQLLTQSDKSKLEDAFYVPSWVPVGS